MSTECSLANHGRHSRTGLVRVLGGTVVGFVVFAVLGPAVAAAPLGPRGRRAAHRPHRVLVLTLPAITWSDLDPASAPHLVRLLDHAGVADLNTRSAMGPARLDDGYITLGTGTRSATDRSTAGDAFELEEPFGSGNASYAFWRRSGRAVRHGLVHLGVASLVSTNAGLRFGGKVGALGDALARAGFDRAVIANADGFEPDRLPQRYRRDAATALMGADGTVPEGAVGPELLRSDPTAPFGVRLSPDAVARAFSSVWHARSVVLVEASDLARADDYQTVATSEQRARQLRQALVWSDALVGRLLARVDLNRDTVLVVAPAHPASAPALTVAAVRAPGAAPGLLRSGTTRRAGFAALVDVAPTILSLLGVDRPTSMEGRPLAVTSSRGSAADRRAVLIQANRDSLFRDSLVDSVTAACVAATIILVVAAVVLGRVPTALRWLQRAALTLIGFLIATYLAGLFHFESHGGTLAFWCFGSVIGICFAALCKIGGRRSALDPLILALAGLALLHTADSFTGAHLELNTVFGYSTTVGIRFAGLGNPTFAQLATAAVLAAGLLAWRVRGRRGVGVAVAILTVSLAALAPPIWGQSLGGTLAAAPTFVLLGWLLAGRSVRVRTVAALVGILAAAGLLVGFLDLLRPSGQRTHVGRFFEQVGNEGWAGFVAVIQRKGSENLSTLSDTHWIVLILVVTAVTAYLWLGPARPLRAAVRHVPALLPVGAALAVLAALGYGLKDSGIAVPGMMLIVAAAAIVYASAAFTGPTASAPPKTE